LSWLGFEPASPYEPEESGLVRAQMNKGGII
jgi:hypothetical protein